MMKVYFTACSGAGKTTLSNYVSGKYGLKQLPSAARSVFVSGGYASWAALLADKAAYADFQDRVIACQIEMERQAGGSFVTDRCIDNFAFTALYGTTASRLYNNTVSRQYLHDIRRDAERGKTLVFRIPPTRTVHAKALADGDRTEYLDWDKMNQFDGMLRFILEVERIPHRVITTEDLDARYGVIDDALEAILNPDPKEKRG